MLRTLTNSNLEHVFVFALKYHNIDFSIKGSIRELSSYRIRLQNTQNEKVDIMICGDGLSMILLEEDMVKDRLTKIILEEISDKNEY